METAVQNYGFLSIVPPFIAIILAITTRRVILSLFVGVLIGATLILGNNPISGFLHVIDRFIQPALADPDHVAIIIFSMLLGGLVGVISKNGGTSGLVSIITKLARTHRGGQLSTWLLGVVIFFDDYANTLIVGNTMRPITDKLKISREKLSFIVDSTAAPIAALTLSTWIGYEIGLIGDALAQTGYTGSAFSVFINCIPYSFYPLLTIFFVFIVAMMRRDFGPMYKAERRADETGIVSETEVDASEDLTGLSHITTKKGTKLRWYNGAIPIIVVIAVSIIGLYVTGIQEIARKGENVINWQHVISNASTFQSLFWASLSGCCVAIFMSVTQRILTISEAMNAWFLGARSMVLAMVILTLAWSIGAVTKEMGTAPYLTQILKDVIHPHWIPALTFVLAAIMSFATGSSWGSMAILIPLVLPLSWTLSSSMGLEPIMIQTTFFATTASVLGGAIFGDHCSPISDTTVMSSMASACNHIDHVRTQLPYALLVAIVCLVGGSIPAGFGLPPYISIAVCAILLVIILRIIGRKIPAASNE